MVNTSCTVMCLAQEGDPANSKNCSMLKSRILLQTKNFCSYGPTESIQTNIIQSTTKRERNRILHEQNRTAADQTCRLLTSAEGRSVEKSRDPVAGDSFWTDPIGQDLPPRAGAFLSKERSAMRSYRQPAAAMAESRVHQDIEREEQRCPQRPTGHRRHQRKEWKQSRADWPPFLRCFTAETSCKTKQTKSNAKTEPALSRLPVATGERTVRKRG
jgi:hypothetical protein